ncbi:MAG: WbuC family cupin fold metalloprotein [Gammaproteobacteria bacterium]|jgi:cupin fold WbuC family metalloprotein
MSSSTKLVRADDLDGLQACGSASERHRTNFNLHEQPDDPVQRLFIAADSESYFRPHRHPTRWEFIIGVRGAFDLLLFDDVGTVTERHRLGPGQAVTAMEIPENTWHTLVPCAGGMVFFETKEGPYDPQRIAEFAPWAPAENSPGVAAFVGRLRHAAPGDNVAE